MTVLVELKFASLSDELCWAKAYMGRGKRESGGTYQRSGKEVHSRARPKQKQKHVTELKKFSIKNALIYKISA